MKFKLSLILFFILFQTASYAEINIRQCDSHFSERLKEVHKETIQELQKINQNLDSLYNDLIDRFDIQATKKDFKIFSKTMRCIQKKLEKETYSYKCPSEKICENLQGRVTNFHIFLNQFLPLGEMKLCPNNIEGKTDDRISALIVHEASHLCGTDDYSYFEGMDRSEMKESYWAKNADTYYNFFYYNYLLR